MHLSTKRIRSALLPPHSLGSCTFKILLIALRSFSLPIYPRDVLLELQYAKLAFNVLRIYDATPILLLEPPVGPRYMASGKPLPQPCESFWPEASVGSFLDKKTLGSISSEVELSCGCMHLPGESRTKAFCELVDAGGFHLRRENSLGTLAYSAFGQVP
jgi:hypothetical protein